MMDRILSYPEIKLPYYIEQGLREESIASYNMGFFGGSDLYFIHRYCDEVFRFMEENRMNDSECLHSSVDCNVFFEQVIFAMMVIREHKKVASVLGRDMRDKGYTSQEFCDLQHYETHSFHHLLGGHKRNAKIPPFLEQAALRRYPDNYRHILSLFPKRHIRFAHGWEKQTMVYLSVERSIAQYEDFLQEKKHEWEKLSIEKVFSIEKQMAANVSFSFEEESMYKNMYVCTIPETIVYHIPSNWNPIAVKIVKERIGCTEQYPLRHIALSPTIVLNGIRETPVSNMDMRILSYLENGEKMFPEIVKQLYSGVSFHSTLERMGACRFVLHQINYLSQNRLIKTYIINE